MLTAEQYDQSAVNFSKHLLLKAEEGRADLETLQQARDQAASERFSTDSRSYAVEGYDIAIAQLTQQ